MLLLFGSFVTGKKAYRAIKACRGDLSKLHYECTLQPRLQIIIIRVAFVIQTQLVELVRVRVHRIERKREIERRKILCKYSPSCADTMSSRSMRRARCCHVIACHRHSAVLFAGVSVCVCASVCIAACSAICTMHLATAMFLALTTNIYNGHHSPLSQLQCFSFHCHSFLFLLFITYFLHIFRCWMSYVCQYFCHHSASR